MKRLFILPTVLVAALVLLAGPAAAAPRELPAHGHNVTHGGAEARTLRFEQAAGKMRYATLGARLAPSTITITGRVDPSTGPSSAGATVTAWVPDGSSWYTSSVTTAADGTFSLQTVTAVGNGEIYAYPAGGGILGRLAMSWGDGTGMIISAGSLSATGVRGGPWGDWSYLTMRLYGDDAFSKGYVDASDTSTSPVTGNFDAQGGTYTSGTVNFFSDEGLEFSGNYPVTPYASSGAIPTAYEKGAQRATVTAPYWASGKPGSTIKVMRSDFPAGWTNGVTGYGDYPANAPVKDFGLRTSAGATNEALSLKVPSTAKAGYWYAVGMQHTNGLAALYLETRFQVCTMKPSRTSVRKGTKIRVTGVVPVKNHWGSTPGTRTTVTLYAHKGTAKVPTAWSPKGWTKVGSVKTNKLGAYTTPYFKPLKTLTLVARYPGDAWYWGAFTSPCKVTVH